MVSRKRWGARPARYLTTDGPKTDVVIHHSAGFGAPIDTFAEQRAVMASIQHQHMVVNGWSDIGYGMVIFQPQGRFRRARAFEGRPFWAIPAAQAGRNSGTIPICVVGNFENEKLKRSTKRLLIKAAKNQRRKRGARNLGGHYQYTSTSCPGKHLKAALNDIAKKAGLKRV